MASMASVPAQSLECVICQELYDEPKQLSCTHTFCQKCLADLLDFSIKENKLTCPVCRQTTQVEDGDVSKLQTNFPIKSLVEDVKSSEQMCTVCDQGTRSRSAAYCQTCGVYMCISCLDAHGRFKLNKKHEVVDSKDIRSGMVKLKQRCKKHPQEEMEWLCLTCKVPICFRCRMLYHNGRNHEVKEIAEIQKALKDKAKTLQKKADDTVEAITKHITAVEEENVKSCTMLDERIADVITAYDDSLGNLTKQKDKLVDKLEKLKGEMKRNLQDIKDWDLKLLSGISSARDLITKGAAGFLKGESLVEHQRLCTELRELMNKADCDDKIPRSITEQAESIKFTRSQSQQDLSLGELTLPGMDGETASANPPRTLEPTHGDKPWKLKKIHSLSTLGRWVSDMAPTPDGRMAVCYYKGGVDIFTVNGLKGTVLKKTAIRSLRFLSDGRCSVIGTDRKFSLYSSKFEKVSSPEIQEKYCFWTSVNKNNEILIGHVEYDDGKCLDDTDYEYLQRGKKAVAGFSVYRSDNTEFVRHVRRECDKSNNRVLCDYGMSQMNHRPHYVGTYKDSDNLLTVEVVNEQFQEINKVSTCKSKPTVVVLEDDCILIAWVKNECCYDKKVTIDLYTHDLSYVRTVLSEFTLCGQDFQIAAYSTGEIALCDRRQLHVFRKDHKV